MLRAIILIVAVTLGSTACAQTALERVRSALDSRDFDTLEVEFAAMDKAIRKGGSARELREITERLMETSHPDRQQVIAAWVQEKPLSTYAAASYAWAALKTVQMYSAQTGNPSNRYKQFPGRYIDMDSFEAAHAEARKAVARAYELGHRFVPAMDAALRSLLLDDVGKEDMIDLVGEIGTSLIKIAPERDSVRIAIAAGIEAAYTPRDAVYFFCDWAHRRVENYPPDVCMIEGAFTHYLGEDLKEAVQQALPAQGDPRLNWLRIKARLATRAPLLNAEFLELRSMLEGLETSDTDLATIAQFGSQIAHLADNPDYAKTFRLDLLKAVDARLEDDPFSTQLLSAKIQLHSGLYLYTKDPLHLSLARNAWERRMVFGHATQDFWLEGGNIVAMTHGIYDSEALGPFQTNQIAYSDHSIMTLTVWFNTLAMDGGAPFDGGTFADVPPERQKALLRAARLIEGLCRRADDMNKPFCDTAQGSMFERGPEVLAAGQNGDFPEIMQARLTDLMYQPTPLQELSTLWPGES
ncbi:MAG: hypothetical protein VX874_07445 [Pseudomonadota bacterium]|nr:hypothetical protein [Pseudomonadota bacterium]